MENQCANRDIERQAFLYLQYLVAFQQFQIIKRNAQEHEQGS